MVKIPSFLGLYKEPTLKCGPSRLHKLDSSNLPRMFGQKSYFVKKLNLELKIQKPNFMVHAYAVFSPCNKMSEMTIPIPILSTCKVIMG